MDFHQDQGILRAYCIEKKSSAPLVSAGHEIKTEYAREMFESSLMRPRHATPSLFFGRSPALRRRFRHAQGACSADAREGPTRPQWFAPGPPRRLPCLCGWDRATKFWYKDRGRWWTDEAWFGLVYWHNPYCRHQIGDAHCGPFFFMYIYIYIYVT